MACECRHAASQWRMRPTIEINMPDTAAFTRKDHLIFVLDDVNAAGVWIEKKRAIAAPRIGTGSFDDDVGHTGGVRTSRLRTGSRCSPTTTPRTSSSRGRGFRSQLRRRNLTRQTAETSCAGGVRAHPVPFDAEVGRRRRRLGP